MAFWLVTFRFVLAAFDPPTRRRLAMTCYEMIQHATGCYDILPLSSAPVTFCLVSFCFLLAAAFDPPAMRRIAMTCYEWLQTATGCSGMVEVATDC